MQCKGPAFLAGLAPGSTIITVDGDVYSDERLKAATTRAKTADFVDRIVKSEGGVAPVGVADNRGLR